MFFTAVINMKNPYALVSMAIVSENSDNPYVAFCEYIKYCIFSCSNSKTTISEIKKSLEKEFGLNMPNNVLIYCLNTIFKDDIISLKDGQIYKNGNVDIKDFDEERDKYKRIEDKVVQALIDFLKNYNKNWEYSYAREQLIRVLDKRGIAHEVFFDKKNKNNTDIVTTAIDNEDESFNIDFDSVESKKDFLIEDENYVGRFINDLLNKDTIERDYLIKACQGLLLCVGMYQIPKNEKDYQLSMIKDTDFFFDTKILLRFLGCANDASVESAKELVKLIQSNGGKVCYYKQTLGEMEKAFERAIKELSMGEMPRDSDMYFYVRNLKVTQVNFLKAKKASFKKELEKENIFERPNSFFSEEDKLKFGFDYKDLCNYMIGKLNWEIQTIENDALSIWETHMRRSGQYNVYCGSKERLPVFVTSNEKLIRIVLSYKKDRTLSNNIQKWNSNRLPVITDIRLTCRLWSPSAQSERMSLLYLTSNAVAAQKPNAAYINRISSFAKQISQIAPEYSGLTLTEYFDDLLTDKLLKVDDPENNITIENFASSLNEISFMKAKKVEEEKESILIENMDLKNEIDEQSKGIINGAVERFQNSLGFDKITLLLILNIKLFSLLIFTIIVGLISYFSGEYKILSTIIIPAIALIVEWILKKRGYSKSIRTNMLKKLLPKVNIRFERRIKDKLSSVESKYSNDICVEAKHRNKVLKSCEKLIEDKE